MGILLKGDQHSSRSSGYESFWPKHDHLKNKMFAKFYFVIWKLLNHTGNPRSTPPLCEDSLLKLWSPVLRHWILKKNGYLPCDNWRITCLWPLELWLTFSLKASNSISGVNHWHWNTSDNCRFPNTSFLFLPGRWLDKAQLLFFNPTNCPVIALYDVCV